MFPFRSFDDNNILHVYCRGKKTFRQYTTLFDLLNTSTLYTPIYSEEYLKEDKIIINETDVSFYKENSYYLAYSDFELLKEDLKDREGYFYYTIADMIQLA